MRLPLALCNHFCNCVRIGKDANTVSSIIEWRERLFKTEEVMADLIHHLEGPGLMTKSAKEDRFWFKI